MALTKRGKVWHTHFVKETAAVDLKIHPLYKRPVPNEIHLK